MSKKPPVQPQRITINASPDIETTYANLARIAHSPADIVFDFAHLLPGTQKAKVSARVVMTPVSAKLLLKALTENLSRYENSFGEIALPKSNTLADNLFKPFLSPDPDAKEE
ncbi:MAG: DUF3467 domain-containing protein [Anaerolineae bacterium]|uniref:DUF3467 domain-containing protein n=1 Tax=Candidatus Desulfolinea nitratireducens TaxID=2841698 RepID=A0A8J6TH41_9CHLR|nr:DUF3467 domain-containing protein [Candidatus Desulfolinea nitratireducens]MBL6961860.1 DUF3467 domain-containing protein [Anaerolineales bacterium]NQU30059.1 DUF3467 domain-containing protein [Anaerolineae bacterium]